MIILSNILKNDFSAQISGQKTESVPENAFTALFSESVRNSNEPTTETSSSAEKNDDSKKEASASEKEVAISNDDKLINNKELSAETPAENSRKSGQNTDEKETDANPQKTKRKTVDKTDVKTNSDSKDIQTELSAKDANNHFLSFLRPGLHYNNNANAPETKKDQSRTGINPETGKTRHEIASSDKQKSGSVFFNDKLIDKNDKIISDLFKDGKFFTRLKKGTGKQSSSNDAESQKTIKTAKPQAGESAGQHIKKNPHIAAHAAHDDKSKSDSSVKTESPGISKENTFLGVQSASLSSESRKDDKGGDFFSFDKDNHNIKSAKQDKPEISTASKIPFSDQLKDILNGSRFNVRDSRNADITIKMNPEVLGEMRVKMEMENGIIRANFTVANEEAKDILMRNMEDIRNALSSNGVNIGEMQVSVKDGGEKREKKDFNFIETNEANIKESSAVYSAQSERYDGLLNLVV